MRGLKITPRTINRAEVKLYLEEINRIDDTLTPEEEAKLAKKIREWDQNALEKLVKANTRFVVTVAKKYDYCYQWLSIADLINEWNRWLIRAAQKFDETTGVRFNSYSIRRIRQFIALAIQRNGRIIDIPVNHYLLKKQIDKFIHIYEQEHYYEPSESEIAEHLDIPLQLLKIHRREMRKTDFFDDLLIWEENEGFRIYEIIEDTTTNLEKTLHHEEQIRSIVEWKLQALKNPIMAYIIRLHRWIGTRDIISDEDIGSYLSPPLTAARIRQIYDEGMKELKKNEERKKVSSNNILEEKESISDYSWKWGKDNKWYEKQLKELYAKIAIPYVIDMEPTNLIPSFSQSNNSTVNNPIKQSRKKKITEYKPYVFYKDDELVTHKYEDPQYKTALLDSLRAKKKIHKNP